jgi:hypothetical protein
MTPASSSRLPTTLLLKKLSSTSMAQILPFRPLFNQRILYSQVFLHQNGSCISNDEDGSFDRSKSHDHFCHCRSSSLQLLVAFKDLDPDEQLRYTCYNESTAKSHSDSKRSSSSKRQFNSGLSQLWVPIDQHPKVFQVLKGS